jgi:pyruvate/2-oxoglutarate dehydrogenase complex dihydrolipoamide dehydrogenase (E3) component
MVEFDFIVKGYGPLKCSTAVHGIDLGKNVCLIVKGKIVGTTRYNGALFAKTLWEQVSQACVQFWKNPFIFKSPVFTDK